MAIFFWKNNRRIDAFGAALAEDLFSHVQPEIARAHFAAGSEARSESRKKHHKIEQRLHALITLMHQFAASNSLGIYGKARLQKSFSDRLLELGYDEAVTTRLVESIILRNL